jgi:hypothetical protein
MKTADSASNKIASWSPAKQNFAARVTSNGSFKDAPSRNAADQVKSGQHQPKK